MPALDMGALVGRLGSVDELNVMGRRIWPWRDGEACGRVDGDAERDGELGAGNSSFLRSVENVELTSSDGSGVCQPANTITHRRSLRFSTVNPPRRASASVPWPWLLRRERDDFDDEPSCELVSGSSWNAACMSDPSRVGINLEWERQHPAAVARDRKANAPVAIVS